MLNDFHLILCTGGREYSDKFRFDEVFTGFIVQRFAIFDPREFIIVQGGCEGLDLIAREWADNNEVISITVPAPWNLFRREKKLPVKYAGKWRNRRMVDIFPIEIVAAFPGHTGTADMMQVARDRGIEVVELM